MRTIGAGETMPAAFEASGAARWIAKHDTAVFLAVTFGLSWPLWLVSGVLWRTPVRAGDWPWLVAQVGVFAPALAGMTIGACVTPGGFRRAVRLLGLVYAPAVALAAWIAARGVPSLNEVDPASTWAVIALGAWILASLGAGRNRLVWWPAPPEDRLRTAVWSAACLIAPIGLFVAAWSMTSAAGMPSLPAMPVRELTSVGVASALAMNLAYGGSLGEEPGWRGAWLPRLLLRYPPVAASLILSFWWALWHAPIDLFQSFGMAGPGALVIRQLWTLPVTIVFTWVTLRAGGSLLPPLILHTTLNTFADFALAQPARYESALSLFWLFLVGVVLVAAFADPRLRRMAGAGAERSGPAGV